MTFGREKRLLLGWMALLAPLPLPFNEVLEWPVLFVYLALVVHFLGRAEDPTHSWLENRTLNALGLLYLPVLAVDAWMGAQRGQMVTSLLHLTLFVLIVKLFSVRQEKEKWHVMLAIFFLFVAAMATSSNIAVMLYLLAALVFGLWALARLAELHMLAALGLKNEVAAAPPGNRLVGLPRPRRGGLLGILAIVLLAVPIFAALPRASQPFLTGRGAGNLSMTRASGFSDEVSLDFSGNIRTSREIALRVKYSQNVPRPEELRFKGAAYDIYRNRRWLRDNDLAEEIFSMSRDGRFELGEGTKVANALVYLEPIQSDSLLIPAEAIVLAFGTSKGPGRLYRDGGGGLMLPFSGRRQTTLEYVIELAAKPNLQGVLARPGENGPTPAALDVSAVTPRMAELARQVMGSGDEVGVDEKILRLERHLLNEYGYTLNISDEGGDPIEDFLFVKKVGHCEYFATAMVLLLRSEGIPARFVTGFLGAEPNAIEDMHVVRQSNAHAWVEAYSPERGWQVYDPTPPGGRPGLAEGNLLLWIRQAYESVAFRWDRWVLTYGAEDQGDLRKRVQELLAKTSRFFKDLLGLEGGEAEQPSLETELATVLSSDEPISSTAMGGTEKLSVALLAFLVVGGAFALLWRRRDPSARAAYLDLRRLLEKAELGISPATAPLELQRQLLMLAPAEEPAAARLIALYLHESFAGEKPGPAEQTEIRDTKLRLQRALRAALKQRRLAAARLDRKAVKVPIIPPTS